jgi:hypothetical protein
MFRADPDTPSVYAVDSLGRTNSTFSDMDTYDGAWWATLQLVDPADGAPLPLAVGAAVLSVSSPLLTQTSSSNGGTYDSFGLEILAATNTPGNETY